MTSQNATSTPIFWGTGSIDDLVKPELAKESSKFLIEQLGIPVATSGVLGGLSYNVYEGVGHSTNQKELDDLKSFIKKAVPK